MCLLTLHLLPLHCHWAVSRQHLRECCVRKRRQLRCLHCCWSATVLLWQCSERFWSLYLPLAGLRALAMRYQQINLDNFTDGKDELLTLQLANLDTAIPTGLCTDLYFRESYAGVCWCWWP